MSDEKKNSNKLIDSLHGSIPFASTQSTAKDSPAPKKPEPKPQPTESASKVAEQSKKKEKS